MTNQYYFLARMAGRDSDLRASDADRERIAQRLRKSHAEGRLDLAEFQERLEHLYEAKTLGQLAQLVRDLPRDDDQGARPSFGWSGPWRWQLARFAPVLIVLLVISAATGHHGHHVFWLWIPLLFFAWRVSWRRRRRRWAAQHGPGEWI